MKGKKSDMVATIIIVIVVVIIVIMIISVLMPKKECKSDKDCINDTYCGYDFKCHKMPVVERTIAPVTKNYNFLWPSLIFGAAIVTAAIILRKKIPKERVIEKLSFEPQQMQRHDFGFEQQPAPPMKTKIEDEKRTDVNRVLAWMIGAGVIASIILLILILVL